MQVTRITNQAAEKSLPDRMYTQEQLQNEFDYFCAKKIVKTMLNLQLISSDEYEEIMKENRQIFMPLLAEIA